MKRTLCFLLRCLVFAILLCLVLSRINRTLEPKYYLHGYYWPTTPTYTQFYDMERDSLDVLFLGSSVAQNEFIPQLLYNEFGIRACNLSSERQSPVISYYWLKEALNRQSPKLVVLETLFLQNRYPDDPLNSSVYLARKALDPMRWSSVKLEAVHDLCARYRNQRELSYFLTNIQYHKRWPELKADDFDTDEYLAPRLYGWAPGVQERFITGFGSGCGSAREIAAMCFEPRRLYSRRKQERESDVRKYLKKLRRPLHFLEASYIIKT